MIRTEQSVAAPAAVAHAVLTDVAAWRLWSPHVAHVDAATEVIDSAGWSGLVKPWFGPATRMDVTWCEPARGIRWTSHAAGHTLEYADLITPHIEGDGRADEGGPGWVGPDQRCTVTMTAHVTGPVGALVQAVATPLSAYGQRRRLARLAALAEYLHRRAIVYAA